MQSVNKIILVGKVAMEPKIRQTSKGTTVATFPLATERDFTSNGERKKVTDFHRIVARGELAEMCGKYLEKGKAVYVEGMASTARTRKAASAASSRRFARTR